MHGIYTGPLRDTNMSGNHPPPKKTPLLKIKEVRHAQVLKIMSLSV